MVEQAALNRHVVGSIPSTRTMLAELGLAEQVFRKHVVAGSIPAASLKLNTEVLAIC